MERSILITGGDGGPPIALGRPRRYLKDAIRTGRFFARHPKTGERVAIDVDDARLKHWTAQFGRMQANGVKVDLTVDHKSGAGAKRGEVVQMYPQDGLLMFATDVQTDADEELVQRCPEVSIEIDPVVEDGLGNRYQDAITAISICRNPVVPGQQAFERIAASRTADNPATVYSPHDPTTATGDPRNPPEPTTMFTDEQKTALRQKLSLKPDADDAAISEALLKAADKPAPKPTGETAKLSRDLEAANDKVQDLTQQLAEAKPTPVAPEILSLSRRALGQELDQLVKDGDLLPAKRDALAESLGTPAMLSLNADTQDPNYAAILDTLRGNGGELAKLAGEKTGGQTAQLSRDALTPENNPLIAAAEDLAKAAS